MGNSVCNNEFYLKIDCIELEECIKRIKQTIISYSEFSSYCAVLSDYISRGGKEYLYYAKKLEKAYVDFNKFESYSYEEDLNIVREIIEDAENKDPFRFLKKFK